MMVLKKALLDSVFLHSLLISLSCFEIKEIASVVLTSYYVKFWFFGDILSWKEFPISWRDVCRVILHMLALLVWPTLRVLGVTHRLRVDMVTISLRDGEMIWVRRGPWAFAVRLYSVLFCHWWFLA